MKRAHCELSKIWYDVEELDRILAQIPDYNWYTFGCNNIRWTVREQIKKYRLECKNILPSPFFEELFSFFRGQLSYDRMLFSKTPPPGVPKHIDRTRQTILNFPIRGTFKNSPQSFWSDFDAEKPKEQFFYHKNEETGFLFPFAFDGQVVHSVENLDDEDRTILSIWFDIPFDQFSSESEFYDRLIDPNFKGKYIKKIQK